MLGRLWGNSYLVKCKGALDFSGLCNALTCVGNIERITAGPIIKGALLLPDFALGALGALGALLAFAPGV